MKKIILVAITVFASIGFANAQIKVVGDDYSDTLTGAKSYYERDVDFEKIFPKAKLGEQYKSIEMNLDFKLNHLGDTVWSYKEGEPGCYYMGSCGCGFGVMSDGSNEEIINVLPIGYYVVSGCIIGKENTAELFSRYFSGEGKVNGEDTKQMFYSFFSKENRYTPSIKRLKESILKSNVTSLPSEYITYIKLSSIDSIDGKHIDYYTAPCGSFFFNVNFYSEIKKEFLNQEVLLTEFSSFCMKQNDTNLYFVKSDGTDLVPTLFPRIKGTSVVDALTEDLIKLNDSVFLVEDVVVKLELEKGEKVPYLYVVLKGDNTGSFAIQPRAIKYQYGIAYYSNDNRILYDEYSNFAIPYMEQKINWNTLIAIRKKDLITIKQHIVDTAAIVQKKKNLDKQKEEKARLACQKEWELSKQKRIEERKRDMIVKYGTEIGVLVGDRKVTIGMTQEMCRDAWGRPMNTYRTTTKYGQGEVWCYNYKTRVYFYNGKVVQIDD